MKRRLVATVAAVGFGLALVGCSTGTSSHAVGSTTTSIVGSPLDTQTLNGVNADLGAVSDDLNQATSDLDNPKSDS